MSSFDLIEENMKLSDIHLAVMKALFALGAVRKLRKHIGVLNVLFTLNHTTHNG